MTDYVVSAGEVSTGIILNDGDTEIVSSGGTAISTIVLSGGTDQIFFGGAASGTFVSNGGQLDVDSGGFASGTILLGVTGDEALDFVDSGGLAVNTVISSGGELVIGGVVSGTIIRSGGFEFGGGGVAYDTVVSAGGDESLDFGDTAIGTIISSGGTQAVYFGTASGTIIRTGGEQGIKSGVAVGTVIEAGGSQIVSTGGMASGTVVLVGGTETLYTGGTVISTTLDSGAAIDLAFLTYAGDGSAVLNEATDVLTVTEGGQTYALSLAGNYTSEFFHLSPGNGNPSDITPTNGTLITVENTPPCYCRGTLILTDRGEAAVEDLRIGDRLVTVSGAARPIRWIGRRSYSGRFVKPGVLPVRFSPGSLADGVPRRDLIVSPEHAMFLDDSLVPAIALLNGVSIIQVESADQVEYFHLELDAHDVILAEGAPSETFVDDGSRAMFHNASDYAALYPDAKDQPARYCAPRVEDGPALEALRRRLAARLEASVVAPGPLLGYIDGVDRGRITGWAKDAAGPVMLQVLNNGVVLGQVEANIHRADLVKAGIGDGRHAFDFAIPGGLSPFERHVIEVRRASDGQGLQQSPWVVEAQRRVA